MPDHQPGAHALSVWKFGFPLLLLALLGIWVGRGGFLSAIARNVPPVEEITFERVSLEPGKITAVVVNTGPSPTSVAQIQVDEAYWTNTVTPGRDLDRLGRATIEIPFPWVEGEPHVVRVVTGTGLTFDHTIDVAMATPKPDAAYFGGFTLVGLYVGVLPVAIGLLWLPFLRRLDRKWIHFALALTAGLLVFLMVDALHEALEIAEQVGGAFQGVGLVAVAALGAWLVLQAFSGAGSRRQGAEDDAAGRTRLAYLIALGIGLHNLGEGLAIGAAYALGEVVLGGTLIIGFMIHNTTEGLGIVAPIAQDRPSLKTLVLAGLLAGGPTIVGAWLGGLAYSPLFATIALAVGAGAILQVLGVLYRLVARQTGGLVWNPANAWGVLAGLCVMYGTGLLVAK
jgi:zinc transporter, ZIP family